MSATVASRAAEHGYEFRRQLDLRFGHLVGATSSMMLGFGERLPSELVWSTRSPYFFGDHLASSLRRVSIWSLRRSEEHTSELQSLMRISYAVFCLKKKTEEKTT